MLEPVRDAKRREMRGKPLVRRIQPVLLAAGYIQSRGVPGEPFRQDEEIVLRRYGFFFAENGCDLRLETERRSTVRHRSQTPEKLAAPA